MILEIMLSNKKDESNNIDINSKSGIKNIKSNFILRKMFELLQKNKFLDLIKLNKKLQKRLNIDIDSYKEYSEIEIEVIPEKNKYDDFIIFKKEDKSFYHIYFDDNKEEVNKTFLIEGDNVSKIKIVIDYQVKSLNKLFYFCECIKSINFKKFNRSNITDMSHMFSWCTALKEINFTNFKTEQIIDMSYMFDGCSLLNKIDLSKFNTNNVKDMNHMFSGCSNLNELNLSTFNTNKVTDMNHMFSNCSSLKELDLSNFNTDNVTNKDFMFSFCYLKKLPDFIDSKQNKKSD